MSRRYGSNFLGSSQIETSTSNQEIIPPAPENWTMGYSFYKFSFFNQDSCTIRINGGNEIWLNPEQGFNSSEVDAPIRSFIVSEGVRYNWLGAY